MKEHTAGDIVNLPFSSSLRLQHSYSTAGYLRPKNEPQETKAELHSKIRKSGVVLYTYLILRQIEKNIKKKFSVSGKGLRGCTDLSDFSVERTLFLFFFLFLNPPADE